MSVRDLPHYTLPAATLADWIESQPEPWWSVDGDHRLTGKANLSSPKVQGTGLGPQVPRSPSVGSASPPAYIALAAGGRLPHRPFRGNSHYRPRGHQVPRLPYRSAQPLSGGLRPPHGPPAPD